MQDFLPSSDLWWRYFIYGAIFHFIAVTPLAKTEKHAELFRFAGYGIGAIPILLRMGVMPAVLMLAFLYGLSYAFKYFKGFFGR